MGRTLTRFLHRQPRAVPLGWTIMALLGAGCGMPKDPEGATPRIAATHVLRAGASSNPPWVVVEKGQVSGIEPDIVRAFAGTLGARVHWVVNGETPLLEALEKRQLDLVVGGVTTKSPWSKRMGASLSYAQAGPTPGGQPGLFKGKQRHVLLAAPGENQLLLRLDQFLEKAKPDLQRRITRRRPMAETSGPDRAHLDQHVRYARRLEYWSIAYLCSTTLLLIVTMSGSQALKTEFVGDLLSMIAPILFLVGDRIGARAPSERFPFGYERAVSAGYLGAALALLATGVYLFFDAASKLAFKEHPIIGGIAIAGHVVWIGWLGIPVLLWSSIPAFFLGRAKECVAHRICDKILLADAQTDAADWQSAGAAIAGVLGIAFGLWWADAVAALIISIEIMRDGVNEVRTALGDLMDRRPEKLGSSEMDPLPEKLTHFLKDQEWVEDAIVRVREKGREYIAEALVIPRGPLPQVDEIERVSASGKTLDDRLEHLALTFRSGFPEQLEAVRPD